MTAALSAKSNGTQAALLVNAAEAFSFDASGVDSPVSIAASATGGALTVTLNKGGWRFRSPTLTNGQPSYVKTDTDLSIVVPSTSNLGRVVNNGVNNLIALLANSGGTPVLCLVNIAGGVNLDETNLLSPTTISGASSSATVVYSSSAVAANSPYRVVGRVDSVFTDGTGWANPSLVQSEGGLFLPSIGPAAYANSGYQRLPGGLILQWGRATLTGNGQTYSFPITFAEACYSLSVMQNTAGGPSLTVSNIANGAIVSTSQFTIATNIASTLYWIAIGK